MQVDDGGLPEPRQKTPDALEETNIAPMTFSLNHNSSVCLPVVSDNRRLIWVHSNQIDLQLDVAADLDKAFSVFPYLTQKQTAALAQRWSLHPDQVKVWFMVQRLRYGISWDCEDIQEVRRRVRSSQGKEELHNRIGEELQESRSQKPKQKEFKVSGGKMGEKAGDESANEARMAENVRATECSESIMRMEQQMKKVMDRKIGVEVEEVSNTHKKQKMTTLTGKIGKKKMKQMLMDEGVVKKPEIELKNYESERERETSIQSETLSTTKKNVNTDKMLLAIHQLLAEKKAVESSARFTPRQDSHVVDACTLPVQTPYHTKTESQLAMMKAAFSHCQYPDRNGYNQLAVVTGIPRYMLVQWFSDMRYYIKKGKPRWMNHEQYSQALATIKYRQRLTTVAKVIPTQGASEEILEDDA
ncbi:uncharacterized protein LOC113122177 [Mastacembelus armatus]|uniref:Zinc fingers and homeoboxes protein 1 n=1 Tax=Mastacembelus armatus TaxID=205130 RepID=A0A3Q3M6M0_9TELE|nr:uncharacterized protein LOC113122177 [Mastacembelus armatus]